MPCSCTLQPRCCCDAPQLAEGGCTIVQDDLLQNEWTTLLQHSSQACQLCVCQVIEGYASLLKQAKQHRQLQVWRLVVSVPCCCSQAAKPASCLSGTSCVAVAMVHTLLALVCVSCRPL